MDFIGAALGDDVDDGAGVATIFGLEVGEHVHFGDGVDGENGRGRAEDARLIDGWVIAVAVIHVGAIEQVVVGAATGAIHGELAEGSGGIGNLVGRAGHAGIEIDELGVVAAVDGHIVDDWQ